MKLQPKRSRSVLLTSAVYVMTLFMAQEWATESNLAEELIGDDGVTLESARAAVVASIEDMFGSTVERLAVLGESADGQKM